MNCKSNHANLYSQQPFIISAINGAHTKSSEQIKLETEIPVNSTNPVLENIHSLNDGSSDREKQEPSKSCFIGNNQSSQQEYMRYISNKIVERHKLIATLCADEEFRQRTWTTGPHYPNHDLSSYPQSRTSKKGRKRTKMTTVRPKEPKPRRRKVHHPDHQ